MKIKFILGGIQTEVPYEEGHTILDTALIAKLAVPYSCMEGTCGTCEARIEGEIVRTCQTLPKSDYVVVDYDKGLK